MKIILEGTDGVGKTSTIEQLKKEGILCQDRSRDMISKYMLFDYSLEERSKKYYEYLKSHDCIILFLVNHDKEKLMNRIYSREKISEFDLEAYEYNTLYQETYDYMKEQDMLCHKLFLVDVTHLSLEEQVNKVRKVILCQV